MKKQKDFQVGDLLTGADPIELYLYMGYNNQTRMYTIQHTSGIIYELLEKDFFSIMKKVC